MKKQVILKIYGRVQLVLFRDSTRRQAKKLGLVGWVMNDLRRMDYLIDDTSV